MKTYGYARVSSADQHADRQLVALKAAGVAQADIFIDRKSGRDFARPAWRKLKKRLAQGDLLIVQSIDRMGRNYAETQEEWRWITKTAGADVQVLDMPLLDTRLHKDLLGTFIADLVLQVLAYCAQSEREAIRTLRTMADNPPEFVSPMLDHDSERRHQNRLKARRERYWKDAEYRRQNKERLRERRQRIKQEGN